MSKKAPEQPMDTARLKAIRAVQTKRRQLGMDDETYRAMLEARTGRSSTKELTLRELCLLAGYLSQQGAVAPSGANADGKKRVRVAAERQPLMSKVHKLLDDLRELNGGQAGSYTLAYADAICAKNRWCTRVDFADTHVLHMLVGTLMRTVTSARKKANRNA